MIFLMLFLLGFILLLFGRAIAHLLGAVLRAIVNQAVKRLDLQKARLRILDQIAGNPSSERIPETIEDIAARQLYAASRRGQGHRQ